jgi:RNA-directed DNA polymerase
MKHDAEAMLAGPWQSAAMEIRLATLRRRISIPPDVTALVQAVLRHFPRKPRKPALDEFLAQPPSLTDPRADSARLCRVLDIDADELAWFADAQGRERRAASALQHYRWRTLPKRGGVRLVAAPKPRLKEIQRRLLRHVANEIRLHDAAHGCVRGRSVRTAVVPHVGAHVVIRLDLESFFPTISAARVRGLLVAMGLSPSVAELVTGLCTTAVPIGVWRAMPRPGDADALAAHARLGGLLRVPHIPQGAPTSPALANAVAYGLDRRLHGLSERFGAQYTRYVDDLTFSGGGFLETHRHRFLDRAGAIVLDEGFRVAFRKTAVLTHAGRLSALGAVFNDHPSLPRPERDRLRAIVHNCVVRGGQSQARGRPQFAAELLGRIAAAGALDPPLGAKLRAEYDRVDWSQETS